MNVLNDKIIYYENTTSEEIKTFFAPDRVIKNNPVIILRALYWNTEKGLPISTHLKKSMKKYSHLLANLNSREIRYLVGEICHNVGGEEKCIELFKEYGLSKCLNK